MKIASAQSIREAERAAFERGETTSSALMDAVVRRMAEVFAPLKPARAVAYVGRGNNGGDAIGLAARLGCPVLVRFPGDELRVSDETRRQLEMCSGAGVCATAPQPMADTLILDGLLGSGARGELSGEFAACVHEMNALREAAPRCRTLAIDMPTGLGTSVAVRADATAAVGCVKPEMLEDGAEDFVGRLYCIPLPEVHIPAACADSVLEPQHPLCRLPRRPYSLYKNRAGRVAVVAGSAGYLGAAQMCAEAAVHAGAGLVALYCHADVYPLLAARVAPEVMVRAVHSYAEIAEPDAQCLLMGPGLGRVEGAEADALRALVDHFPGTVVLDADALNLAAAQGWGFHRRCILTPHPGEMHRLDPRPAAPRREVVRRFLERHDCTLLLKGARTIVADRAHACYNSTGGPFMANGGQGDTLSGCIAALAAQGLPPLHAAALGAYSCGLAAERIHRRTGAIATTATQVAAELPAALGGA
ncbi:MAG: NAD(P)H-hydrate dehydratase [Akkermansia sp.]|nr:NAD(P)H-hydrate dehydratase [Akkermansia sp.]